MNRRTANLYTDLGLFVAFAFVLASALVLWFLLPSGPEARGLTVLGLPRRDWTRVHRLSGVAMTALVAVHLALHWQYLASMPTLLRQ